MGRAAFATTRWPFRTTARKGASVDDARQQWNEHDLREVLLVDVALRVLAQHQQALRTRAADRRDQGAGRRELRGERILQRRRAGGDDDGVERRVFRPADAAVVVLAAHVQPERAETL